VLDVLRFHRRVFLSQEKARVGGGKTELRGIVSRLQGRDRKEKWDGASSIKIDYQSLVEMPLLLQVHGSAGDRDLLYGLRGFQLKSTVRVVGRPLKQGIRVYFEDWQAQISDRYDFDYDEGITVPNPDFGSSAAGAIAPNEEKVLVQHSNAKRVEDANLAAPFDLCSKEFYVGEASVKAPGDVDPSLM
jgi:hypothetical protein